MDGEKRNVGAHHANVSRDLLKFVLKGGHFGAHLELLDDFTEAGEVTHHQADHFAFTLGDGGARHQDGGRKVVFARNFGDSLVDILFLLLLNAHALLMSFLLDFVGLSSHGRLVAEQLGTLDKETVNRNVHAVLNLNDITDVEVVVVQGHHLAVAKHVALKEVSIWARKV